MKYLALLSVTLSLSGPAMAATTVPTQDEMTQPGSALNDYPTDARAEYVFACMATNGGTRAALEHCSCSIDQIAAELPFDEYQKAETVLRMRIGAGGYFHDMMGAPGPNKMVEDLKEAQAEADVRCF